MTTESILYSKNLLEQVEKKIIQSYQRPEYTKLSFHSLEHIQRVVQAVINFSLAHGLTKRESHLVQIAAWFHDLGFDCAYQGHEEASVRHMRAFMNGKLPEEDLMIIEDCILATQMPQNPNTLLEEIICDADLSHLGSSDYSVWLQRLRQEWESVLHKTFSEEEWKSFNVQFLSEHQFHTQHARLVLSESKQENIANLECQLV